MFTTVAQPSGSDGPRAVRDQLASAVQHLERLVVTQTDRVVSDEEIENLHELIHRTNRVLATVTNARRGPNRLPTELLRAILLQALRPVDLSQLVATGPSWNEDPDHGIGLGWPNEHKRVRDVMALAHVCQHWRSVALAFPDLWQSVVLSSPHSASEMNIELAPMLERLCVPKTVVAGNSGFGPGPRSVLLGETSNVRYLSIVEHHWFPGGQFPALTHLILVQRIHALQMGMILDHCPNLQTVVCRTADGWEDVEDPHTIRLPQLRRLSLECATLLDESLIRFLAKLGFDRSRAAVRVSFEDRSGEQRNLLVAPLPLQTMPGLQPRASACCPHLCIKAGGSPRGPGAAGRVCLKGRSAMHHLVPQHFRNRVLQHVTELLVDGLTHEIPKVLGEWRRALSAFRTLVVSCRPRPIGTEGGGDVPEAPGRLAAGDSRGHRGSSPHCTGLTECLKTMFEIHPVRIFVSDGRRSVAGPGIEETRSREDPELTAWAVW
ncbi:hypothetical protein OH76DRAFT_1473369 [Lentinus brumalis]|uniref:Uncharacterized protein n=1 Tax=Lentinus brumalis TaxID=2498619 RepID=A0A371D1T7_9APHY|nr:hypothetical protein OH76DRAFT_1473369 [Polyporus brumalis]